MLSGGRASAEVLRESVSEGARTHEKSIASVLFMPGDPEPFRFSGCRPPCGCRSDTPSPRSPFRRSTSHSRSSGGHRSYTRAL